MKSSGERCLPLTVLCCSLGYLSYVVSKGVFVLCLVPVLLVLLPFPRARHRTIHALIHRYLALFTRGWLPVIGVYRVAGIAGLDRVLAARPAVVVANHRGFMDAILLLGLVPHLGVVIKSRDTRQPMYALLAKYFDLVSLDRHSLRSVGASLEKCRRVLAEGRSLLVFPEGTRARNGRLQRFNALAFQLAQAARVPVVPVIVHSTQPFMAKLPGSVFPRGRNDYRIHFLDPEPPAPDDDANTLCDRVHRRMARALNALDVGTCWENRTPENHD